MNLRKIVLYAVGVVAVLCLIGVMVGCGSSKPRASHTLECDVDDQREYDKDCGYRLEDGQWVWHSWVVQGETRTSPEGWVNPDPDPEPEDESGHKSKSKKKSTPKVKLPVNGTKPAAPAPKVPVAPVPPVAKAPVVAPKPAAPAVKAPIKVPAPRFGKR